MSIKSDSNDGSGRIQMGGQVHAEGRKPSLHVPGDQPISVNLD